MPHRALKCFSISHFYHSDDCYWTGTTVTLQIFVMHWIRQSKSVWLPRVKRALCFWAEPKRFKCVPWHYKQTSNSWTLPFRVANKNTVYSLHLHSKFGELWFKLTFLVLIGFHVPKGCYNNTFYMMPSLLQCTVVLCSLRPFHLKASHTVLRSMFRITVIKNWCQSHEGKTSRQCGEEDALI